MVALGGNPNWVLNAQGIDKILAVAIIEQAIEIHDLWEENLAIRIASKMPRMM